MMPIIDLILIMICAPNVVYLFIEF